jgi:hypothetical protein
VPGHPGLAATLDVDPGACALQRQGDPDTRAGLGLLLGERCARPRRRLDDPRARHVRQAQHGAGDGRAGHLVSWAKFAPGVKESAGKKKGKNTTGYGNSYLARVLGNAAVSADRTDTFLGERYRRIARRRGRKKAVVAIGRSLLVIIWHLLADPSTRYTDLGSDFHDTRINPERRKRNHIRQFEALGYKVTPEPAA